MVAVPSLSVVVGQFARRLAPEPELTCGQWADRFRYLSAESSARAGKYSSSRTPYQRGPMADVSDPEVAGVCLMWASQLGKTEILSNVVGYFIHQDPAPLLMVQPTVELAESWSKERLTPMLRDTPVLSGLVNEARSRDSGNTLLHKTFPGGNIAIVGANAPSGLAGRPRRVVLLDEIDRYPTSAGTEGDPCALAEKRTESFFNAVLVRTSTPTVRGGSRIEIEFEQSDQRRWFCPCPACHAFQTLKWAQVRWPKDDPEAAFYECEACKAKLDDRQRVEMVRAGEWRAQFPARHYRGYHLNGIASVFRCRRGFKNRLHQMAADFLKAKAGGVLTMRVWVNTFLAETFVEDAERVAATEVQGRAEDYGCEVPEGVLLLTGAVDVQGDRLVYEVAGWGENEESWGIEYKTVPGRPDDSRTWERLDKELLRRWKRADGRELSLVAVGVDYGSFPDYVLKWTRTRFARGVVAVKGSSQAGAPIVSAVRRSNRYKAAAVSVGTDQAKSLIYARLKVPVGGPGQMHFPTVAAGYDAEYFAELTAEELRVTFRRGFAHREWHQMRARNEALDVRVYGLAMLRWLNPDWLRVQRSQRPKASVDLPADPTKAGTIDPDAGPMRTGRPDAEQPRPRPVRMQPRVRNFLQGWRKF